MPSTSPDSKAARRVALFGMNRTVTCSQAGIPDQACGLRTSSTRSSRAKETKRYGPVPTMPTPRANSSVVWPSVACLLTMKMVLRSLSSSGYGPLVVSTSVCGSGADLPMMPRVYMANPAGLFTSVVGRSSDQMTSSAVSGEPSWKRASWRRWNSQVWSSRSFQDSARLGCSRLSASIRTRVSKTFCETLRLAARLWKCGSMALGEELNAIRRSAASAGPADSVAAAAAAARNTWNIRRIAHSSIAAGIIGSRRGAVKAAVVDLRGAAELHAGSPKAGLPWH